MALGEQTITRGNVQATLVLLAQLTPVATAATTAAAQTFTIPGLLAGDQISDITLANADVTVLVSIVNSRVTSTGLLSVSFSNSSASPATYPAGLYLIEVNRPSGTPLVGVIQ